MGLLSPTSGEIYVDDELVTNEIQYLGGKKLSCPTRYIFNKWFNFREYCSRVPEHKVDKIKAGIAKKSEIFNFIQSLKQIL